MKPLISKTKLLQELVNKYDVEEGEKVSSATIYSMILKQPTIAAVSYWRPAIDGDGMVCDKCETDIPILSFHHYIYCPYCGRYMINNDEFIRDKRGYERCE